MAGSYCQRDMLLKAPEGKVSKMERGYRSSPGQSVPL